MNIEIVNHKKKITKRLTTKLSKSKHIIPIYNTIPLHSLIDPLLEAYDLYCSLEEKIQKNEKILVLGLGFGYHLNHLIKKLKDSNSLKEIVVFCEHRILKNICLQKKLLIDYPKLTIYTPRELQKNRGNYLLSSFLANDPLLYTNTSATTICSQIFSDIYNYNAPLLLKELSYAINKKETRQFLHDLPQELTIKNYVNLRKNTPSKIMPFDYLLTCVNSLTNPVAQ